MKVHVRHRCIAMLCLEAPSKEDKSDVLTIMRVGWDGAGDGHIS